MEGYLEHFTRVALSVGVHGWSAWSPLNLTLHLCLSLIVCRLPLSLNLSLRSPVSPRLTLGFSLLHFSCGIASFSTACVDFILDSLAVFR